MESLCNIPGNWACNLGMGSWARSRSVRIYNHEHHMSDIRNRDSFFPMMRSYLIDGFFVVIFVSRFIIVLMMRYEMKLVSYIIEVMNLDLCVRP